MSTHTFYNVKERWEGSKLPLNSWAVGRDGYTWENKRKSEEEGVGGRSGSPDSPLVKLTWLKQSQASLSPSYSALWRKPSTFAILACSLPLSRKTQTTKEKTLLIKGRHPKDPPPPLESRIYNHVVESALSHVNEVNTHRPAMFLCVSATLDWTLPFHPDRLYEGGGIICYRLTEALKLRSKICKLPKD